MKESGLSRATIYRQFPGGRDELLLETVGWELANYFNALADHVRDAPDLVQLLEQGLVYAHRSLGEHAVLGKILDTEPERLLPLLTVESAKTLPFIADFLHPYLVREARGRPAAGRGSTSIGAADYLARCILSLINAPGRWDLDDPGPGAGARPGRAPRRDRRMTDPDEPPEPPSPERPSLGRRLVKSAFAPDVCEDGGHDAPLSPRGRLLFRGVVAVLVVAIVVLFVVTLARRSNARCVSGPHSCVGPETHGLDRQCSRSRAAM